MVDTPSRTGSPAAHDTDLIIIGGGPAGTAFDGCSGCGQCPVDRLLCWGQLPAGRSSAPGGDPGAGALVGAVGQDGDALAFADPDDPVGAGRGQVVAPAWQGRRDPQHMPGRIGHDLHVHAVATVLCE